MMIVDDPRDYGKWIALAHDVELGKRLWFREHEDGLVEFHTETDVEELVEQNKASLNESAGQRWGDGKVVASIDLPTYFNKLVPARLNGDDAYLKRWLNDSDNRAYRTFKGNI